MLSLKTIVCHAFLWLQNLKILPSNFHQLSPGQSLNWGCSPIFTPFSVGWQQEECHYMATGSPCGIHGLGPIDFLSIMQGFTCLSVSTNDSTSGSHPASSLLATPSHTASDFNSISLQLVGKSWALQQAVAEQIFNLMQSFISQMT